MELPPELRNEVYRSALQPSEVKNHVKFGVAPALLKVSHQINAEVQSLYYSREFMNVEYYDAQSESWVSEEDTKLFRFILAQRHCCNLGAVTKSGHAKNLHSGMLPEWPGPSVFRRGVFTWQGLPESAEVSCYYYTGAIEREDRERRQKAEREEMKRQQKARMKDLERRQKARMEDRERRREARMEEIGRQFEAEMEEIGRQYDGGWP